MSLDLHSMIEVELFHLDAAVAADANGTGFDLTGYSAAEVIVYLGASGSFVDDTATWDLELEECATLAGTYTDVAEADLIGALSGTTVGRFAHLNAAAEDELFYRVGYIGNLQFIRLHIEKTGAPDNLPVYAFLVKHAGTVIPTPNP